MLDSHDDDEERVLREHIRSLLYDAFEQHLTVDHVQFTTDAVSELLEESLKMIPLHDKNALRLPMDPWERLTELLELQGVAPYQEKFQITAEVSQYLKSAMRTGKGPPKTERLIKECPVDVSAASHQTLMTSSLSLKSIRSTPRPGSGQFTRGLPTSHSNLAPVLLPQLEDTAVAQIDLLNLTWRLQAEEHHAVSALLKSAASLSRPGANYRNPYLDPRVLPDSPRIHLRREESVPIFPRSQRIRGGTTQKAKILPDFQSMADLPKKIPPVVKVEEDDVDMFRENMRVVDGWQVFSSISSPPSLSSSQEDNVDELFNLPSPDTSPLSLQTFSKMEVPPIPRNRRIRGSSHPAKRRKANESLASFLLDHLRLSHVAEESTRHSPEPSWSIVGQPSTLKHDDLDDDVAAICHSVKESDCKTIIMDETLTASESLLMKVPMLSAPNVHAANNLFLPLSFGDFVAAKSNQAADSPIILHQFLKKAKGLKSLNLTLSWTPFSVKEKLPNNMQVTGSTILLDSDGTKLGLPTEHIENEVHNLIESLAVFDRDPVPDEERWTDYQPFESGPSSNDITIVLSRVERRRTNGVEDPIFSVDESDSDKENNPHPPPYSKQIFLSAHHARDEIDDLNSMRLVDDEENHPVSRSTKRQRLDLHNDTDFLEQGLFVQPALDHHNFPFSYSGPLGHDIEQEPMQAGNFSYPEVDVVERQPSFGHSSPLRLLPGPFHPLSLELDSYEGLSRAQSILRPSHTLDDNQHLTVEPQALQADGLSQDLTPANVCFDPDQDTPFAEPSLASHAAGLSEFLRLRARRFLETQPVLRQPAPSQMDRPITPDILPTAPPELYDKNTFRLPVRKPPTHEHHYFASIDLLQKNVLLRILRSSDCAVNFVEREHLSGVDLILDANTSIIFASLVSLASQREALIANISEQSWRYRQILVVFEAYPISCSFKAAEKHDASFNAYTPPAIKAIGRLRRDLSLMEACEKKSTSCSVHTAFADSVYEAALFTRYYGDMAEQLDGTLWGDRPWLDGEVPAEEESLAAVPRMNHFAAYVILCQINVDDFLALSSEERMEMFALLVGEERMLSVNECIESRTKALESSDLDPNVASA